ncbi:leucine-rich repeat receptor-like protein kinase PXC1 [Camellia sinensis]|uniref:leucine-rich repeat receptor-like protein kinase PXC1 n=1 Tax=Camellia sinensis TaxID=4442 RepID=UPI001035D08C|nr:leucine-rich repeat receptor-like protein kinase PXC1 [Camellia sinensis]
MEFICFSKRKLKCSYSTINLSLSLSLVAYCCGRGSRDSNSRSESESGKRRSSSSYEKKVYANTACDSDGTNATDRSKLVLFDRKKQFELEDLLRASAEMLGKGSIGTVYRAVLDDGFTVAVKRLKDANPCARNEFEQYMDVIGKLKHPNIVRLRAYYYAKEEKLLVYDYLPNGSLHSLLHGNRGPGRIPLDWTTRISLVLGAARGLARIHEEYSATKIPHGNVKSSNVLLDKNGVACISDFGLALLLNPVHATARLGGYRAPEQVEIKRLSQKADVYSFGVLLLEVLTGRAPSQYPSPTRPRVVEEEEAVDLPKWVRSVVRDEWTAEVFDQELLRYKNIEEELVEMLHVGLACVAAQPEKRPAMVEVAKMIEEIRVEQSPIGEDYDESRHTQPSNQETNGVDVGLLGEKNNFYLDMEIGDDILSHIDLGSYGGVRTTVGESHVQRDDLGLGETEGHMNENDTECQRDETDTEGQRDKGTRRAHDSDLDKSDYEGCIDDEYGICIDDDKLYESNIDADVEWSRVQQIVQGENWDAEVLNFNEEAEESDINSDYGDSDE